MSLAASVGVCVSVCMSVSEKRIFASENQSAAKVNIVKSHASKDLSNRFPPALSFFSTSVMCMTPAR